VDQRPSHGGRLAPAAFKGDARLLRAAFQAWRPQLRCLATPQMREWKRVRRAGGKCRHREVRGRPRLLIDNWWIGRQPVRAPDDHRESRGKWG
jgi:hypothetical protein